MQFDMQFDMAQIISLLSLFWTLSIGVLFFLIYRSEQRGLPDPTE
jgi:hypothetical protein